MKYKALFLDVDGTVVPYDYNSLPSDTLAQALRIVQNKIAVCFVTGRSFAFLKPVLKKIDMHKGYAVVNNGANVLDLATNRVLYDQPINKKDIKKICALLENEKVTFYIKRGLHDANYIDSPFKKGQRINKASMIFSEEFYGSETVDEIQKKLSRYFPALKFLLILDLSHQKKF